MSCAQFVHLHLHSSYSLLNSTVRIEAAIAQARAERMPALALTDQANLFAAIQFYTAALAAGIKPILGAQLYLVPDRRDRTPRTNPPDQVLLLCRDQRGWHNLMRLVSIGYLDGFVDRPCIDFELLSSHCAGLIALSAGAKGEVGRLLKSDQPAAARAAAERWRDQFLENGQPNFYLELHRHSLPGEEELLTRTVELAHSLNLPLVATNDIHFLTTADHRAHDALVCVGDGVTMFDPNRRQYPTTQWFKPATAMLELFADLPEACLNTLQIAKRCNLQLQLGKPQLPDFAVPVGHTLEEWLRQEAINGLDNRLARIPELTPAHRAQYRERLDYELDVIIQMGFPGYFLIVSDFIRHAKRNGIPVGPGRGSGAGSVAAWALDITDLDPTRYNLLFERFLNPERVSMPDFDVDFCMDRRDQVIRYVQDRYGSNRVAQIITFGTLQARAAIRDVGRVLEMSYPEVDRIAKLIPNVLGITLKQAIEQEERLARLISEEESVKALMELAQALEGLPRSAGTHAAGVVISNRELVDTVPLYLDPRSEVPATQFNMIDVEKAGLVKFDFLGLKTLTVIDATLQLANRKLAAQGHPPIDITTLDLDDGLTYQLLREGRTQGVFQLESSGMREILKKLAPDTFEDIVALVALYRPGPLGSGMVDDFIQRKHGQAELAYPLPQLEPVLRDTYGVILYQEQVMKIAQVLAGYTLGGADLLRRAMGKKKKKEMDQQREVFMNGAERNGIPTERAAFIFDLMEKFAGYGFNKSHSAAYALISFQTAWLKAHHPVEFLAATMSCEIANTDKVMRFVRECRQLRIPVLPPSVNHSRAEFSVEEGQVRYGLAAIKNVGEGAVEEIVKARERGQPFGSLFELCDRVAAGILNRRMLEGLVKCGACDCLGGTRAGLLAAIPQALSSGSRRQGERRQRGLFAQELPELRQGETRVATTPELDPRELLAMEKESIGFYFTTHPLQRYELELQEYGVESITAVHERFGAKCGEEPPPPEPAPPRRGRRGAERPKVKVAGICIERKIHRTRNGERMAFLTLEDRYGQVEAVLFPDPYQLHRELLEGERALVAECGVDTTGEEVKLTVDRMWDIDGFRQENCRELRIEVEATAAVGDWATQLEGIITRHAGGTCRVVARVHFPEVVAVMLLGDTVRVIPSDRLVSECQAVFGNDRVALGR